ncbi:MAG: hypothetical protein PGN13_06705 [Patulibacter minatonensis]
MPGISDTITVTSVLGRFLEHSRIYAFEIEGEEREVYIGSADLMPRNLDNRVELVVPLVEEAARGEVFDVLDRSLADEEGAWRLSEDGSWTPVMPDGAGRSVQRELLAGRSRGVGRTPPGAAARPAPLRQPRAGAPHAW